MMIRKIPQRPSRAGALISALLITAIVAILATALSVQQQLLIHTGELAVNADQGYLNLQRAQMAAKMQVVAYAAQWANPEALPLSIKPLKNKLKINVNGMDVRTTIEDEQGKFNLNNLVYTANENSFVALLHAVDANISKRNCFMIASAIANWMSSGNDNTYYLSQHPPYQSSKMEFANISELYLIKGVTPKIVADLAPFVTALPVKRALGNQNAQSQMQTQTPIDVNAASAQVLLTTNPALTLDQADSIIACRDQNNGFAALQNFNTSCVAPSGVGALNNIGVSSQYYLIQSEGVFGRHLLILKSLVVTALQKNNKLDARVVWQEFE